MLFLIFKCLFLLLSTTLTATEAWSATKPFIFAPYPLKTIEDCTVFGEQNVYFGVRMPVYYDYKHANENLRQFYLDRQFKNPLIDCVMRMATMVKMPMIIYKVMNTNNFSIINADLLEKKTEKVAIVVPEVTYLIGPGGKLGDFSLEVNTMRVSWVALKVSEKQNIHAYYTQKFFDDLYYSANIFTPIKYLILNGWHLKNIETPPNLMNNLLRLFDGLLIWVSPHGSEKIGKNQVVRFLNGSQFPVFMQMYNSPDFLSNGVIGFGKGGSLGVILIIGLVLIEWL